MRKPQTIFQDASYPEALAQLRQAVKERGELYSPLIQGNDQPKNLGELLEEKKLILRENRSLRIWIPEHAQESPQVWLNTYAKKYFDSLSYNQHFSDQSGRTFILPLMLIYPAPQSVFTVIFENDKQELCTLHFSCLNDISTFSPRKPFTFIYAFNKNPTDKRYPQEGEVSGYKSTLIVGGDAEGAFNSKALTETNINLICEEIGHSAIASWVRLFFSCKNIDEYFSIKALVSILSSYLTISPEGLSVEGFASDAPPISISFPEYKEASLRCADNKLLNKAADIITDCEKVDIPFSGLASQRIVFLTLIATHAASPELRRLCSEGLEQAYTVAGRSRDSIKPLSDEVLKTTKTLPKTSRVNKFSILKRLALYAPEADYHEPATDTLDPKASCVKAALEEIIKLHKAEYGAALVHAKSNRLTRLFSSRPLKSKGDLENMRLIIDNLASNITDNKLGWSSYFIRLHKVVSGIPLDEDESLIHPSLEAHTSQKTREEIYQLFELDAPVQAQVSSPATQ